MKNQNAKVKNKNGIAGKRETFGKIKEGDEGPGEDRNWRRPADGTRIPMGVVEENEIKEGDEGPGERSRRPDDTRMPMEVVQEQEGGSGCPCKEKPLEEEEKINKWKGMVK